MGTTHQSRFWQYREDYHDLAQTYNSQIELQYPSEVTSNRLCSCLDYVSYCGWARTKVVYYEHTK